MLHCHFRSYIPNVHFCGSTSHKVSLHIFAGTQVTKCHNGFASVFSQFSDNDITPTEGLTFLVLRQVSHSL